MTTIKTSHLFFLSLFIIQKTDELILRSKLIRYEVNKTKQVGFISISSEPNLIYSNKGIVKKIAAIRDSIIYASYDSIGSIVLSFLSDPI